MKRTTALKKAIFHMKKYVEYIKISKIDEWYAISESSQEFVHDLEDELEKMKESVE